MKSPELLMLFLTIALLIRSSAVGYRTAQLSAEKQFELIQQTADKLFLASNIVITGILIWGISDYVTAHIKNKKQLKIIQTTKNLGIIIILLGVILQYL